MQRLSCVPRPNWQARILEQGLNFSDEEGRHYWNETAYYQFNAEQIDQLEAATQQLHEMCLQAVEHVIEHNRWDEFEIPVPFREWITQSWRRQEPSIYGRFDLWFDGRDIKLLEYNADTPTGLIEAAVVQWHWMEDNFGRRVDQFNSIHERLIDSWGKLRVAEAIQTLHFTSIDDGEEDFMTANYLRDTATQAGLHTAYLGIERIGWNAASKTFRDSREKVIDWIFKLYPWEWLLREEFGAHLVTAETRWVEPPWKAILSNKALLVALWELFPEHPLLLRAQFDAWSDTYARKPIFGREGANVLLRREGQELAAATGLYTGRAVYQELCELPAFDGRYPVIGSWVVGGLSCGIGIRESDRLVTTNGSYFVPHIFS